MAGTFCNVNAYSNADFWTVHKLNWDNIAVEIIPFKNYVEVEGKKDKIFTGIK